MATPNPALLMIARKVPGCDPNEALELLESASELGDTQADMILALLDANAAALDRGQSSARH